MKFMRVFSKAPWEKKIGYCRALRAGNQVFVTGTAPINEDGSTFAPGKPYEQAFRCFELIQKHLENSDAKLSDVTRTRMFVTDISHWEEYGKAHYHFFKEYPPATSMIEVKGLICKDMMIEVEVDAVIQE